MTCEIFRRAFVDWFSPRETSKDKVEDFIDILQEGMSVLEYSLNFIKFSKYALPLVSNPRDEKPICDRSVHKLDRRISYSDASLTIWIFLT